jgi:hypothetical protein
MGYEVFTLQSTKNKSRKKFAHKVSRLSIGLQVFLFSTGHPEPRLTLGKECVGSSCRAGQPTVSTPLNLTHKEFVFILMAN